MSEEAVRPLTISLSALPDFPLVNPGDDLPTLVMAAMETARLSFEPGDILVVAQKIFSKTENRFVDLHTVTPSERAVELSKTVNKDPRLVEVILGESKDVVRQQKDVLIVEHHLGFVMANAGIDQSNVGPDADDTIVLLLPEDPDASCRNLSAGLSEKTGLDIPVIMNDSHGRAWRLGTVGVAIGVSGLPPVVDLTGQPDLFDRPLRVTEVGMVDELAAAGSLVMGQADEGCPVVLVRGVRPLSAHAKTRPLMRPRSQDLFR